ncbi:MULTISPECIES: ABC transporter permease [unclassified Colwellia]|nr:MULTISPECIES: ABC transporter permease [unclassified Colwellia]MBA6234481.1 ABC transporter permease [Colwellia sp. MB02u-7]MBA6236902.1 ABC transporter permease [Colwellia sp. MB02u-11]MBA6256155.1 ABC transporter permease [Colwellia sp. MB3u-28]MBA6260039.1 ABC transporter permease [Colwellia sp. MB3u-41]MBA6299958.1 ABC transporter permease [Colwellia sp. MB3u-22]
MNLFIYQLKQAFLGLKKKPAFVFSVVSTMGITLGALLCVVTLAYVMLIKPLPYPEQERLFLVESTVVDKDQKKIFSAFNYRSLVNLYRKQTSFESAALLAYGKNVLVSQPSQPQVITTYVTPETFELLNIPMVIGRSFGIDEQLDSYNPVAILSYDTWQNEFAGSIDILDEKLVVDNVSFSIIGVVAERFVEPKTYYIKHPLTDVWFPWDYNYISAERRKETGSMSLDTMFLGRTIKGLSSSQVEQTITPLVNLPWKEMVSEFEYYSSKNIQMKLTPLKEILIGDSNNIIFMLIAGVLGVLLVAVTNIANLFMARAAEQKGLYSVHASLGASKSTLFKTMLSDAALLMFSSLLLAFVVALVGFELLSKHLLEILPRVNELSFSYFSFCLTGLIFFTFTWIFAKLLSKSIDHENLNTQLKSGIKGGSKQVSKGKRQFLIVSQIAIATLLVFINLNLFIDTWKVINNPLSINIENTIHVEMSTDPTTTLTDEEKIQINKNIQSALEVLPQVERVSLANGSPFIVGQGIRQARVKGSETTYPGSSLKIDNDYFALYQHKLIAGDFFSKSDVLDENKIAIVNEDFAKIVAPTGSAIGKELEFFGEYIYTITGVIKGFKKPGEVENENRIYFPGVSARSRIVIRLKEQAKFSRQEFASFLKTVTSKYRVQLFETDHNKKNEMLFIHYMVLTTTGFLALLTFFLAAIGLYGVLSYSTQMRQFEIGTRLAVGAKRGDVIKLIIKDNVSAILSGVLVSIGALLLLTIGFSEQISRYLTLQLLPIFIVTLALVSVLSLFACYIPLRQYINKPVIHSLKGSE